MIANMSHHNPNRACSQPYSDLSATRYQYNGQIPDLHIDIVPVEPWQSSQRPQLLQDVRNRRLSSPGSANNTTHTTHSRDPNHMNYSQEFSPLDGGIGFEMPRESSFLDPNYVPHYYNASASRMPEPAWSPFNLRNPQSGVSHGPQRQPYTNFRFSHGPKSDIGSQASPSDEGYFSHNTQSVMSNEPDCVDHELPANFLSNMDGMHVESVTSEAPTMSRMPSDQQSLVSSRSNKSKKAYHCPKCPVMLKCNSEFKKHMLKHDKPFKCEVAGCKRTEGFTTTNDLDRHRRSLHQKGIDNKSYRCAVENCRNRGKTWPRLDNFKQHVERMHKDDDVGDVIKRSICYPKNDDSSTEETSVAPMDIDIAVSGMENTLSISPSLSVPPLLDFLTPQSARHSFSPGPGLNPVEIVKSQSRPSRGRPTSAPHNAGILKTQKSTQPQYHAPGVSFKRTQKPLLTTKTASRALGRNNLKIQQSSSSSALSNAPQTKAEQQKELKKKSERQSRSPNPVNLESLMSEMIQKAKEHIKCEDGSAEQSMPEKNAVLMDMVTKLLNSDPGSSHAGQRRSSKDAPPNDKKCPHLHCGVVVARECDLRKHMKRHDRPYGCTYPKCHKRFGAKSDWKRHENSQHFQQEAFRCEEKLPTGETCGVHLHREGAFKNHLEKQHKIAYEGIQKRLTDSKIGKNCQGSFWCGLCGAVKQLKERRIAAWDERFDHIAHHFEKEKKSIDEWICAEENRPKKDLLEEKLKCERFDDEDERDKDCDVDAVGEDDDDDAPQPRPRPPQHNMSGMPMSVHATTTSPPPPPGFVKANKRKRSVEEDTYGPRSPKRKQTMLIVNRYCCSCRSPCGVVDVACTSCPHRLCNSCDFQEEEAFMMESMDFFG
ncbi:hypothetical protein ACET3X_006803 [Alternaria dauci]|uniref:C2H2-type domain-containing protein n=1 Tax=Alternaria dauci TaxID=48095 RepID=A0ABR3UFJ9_9PLEO